MVRHRGVDLSGKLDEPGGYVELPRLPGEVERVDGDAVAAKPGTGPEGHVAEGLGAGGLDHVPDVDAHGIEDHLEFVDEGDVDGAEDVLGELDRFSGFRVRDDNGSGRDEGVIEGCGGGPRQVMITADDLGHRSETMGGVSRIVAFG